MAILRKTDELPEGTARQMADMLVKNAEQKNTDYAAEATKYARAGDLDGFNNAMAGRAQKIIKTGNDGGVSNNQLYNQLYNEYFAPYNTPTYDSKYRDKQSDAVNDYAKMSFANWKQGDEYKSLVDSYTRQGQKVMEDVLGQVSSRTGGLASSYATTASQQQYNDFMAQLESVAREMYSSDKNDKYNLASLYGNMDQTEWSRYQDNLNHQNYINQTNYERDRDAIADKRYEDENTKADAQNQIYNHLNRGGKVADIPQNILEASGLDSVLLNAYEASYVDPQAMTRSEAQERIAWGIELGLTPDQLDPAIIEQSGLSQTEINAMYNKEEKGTVMVPFLGEVTYDQLLTLVEQGLVREDKTEDGRYIYTRVG